jgi:hypothetical protein
MHRLPQRLALSARGVHGHIQYTVQRCSNCSLAGQFLLSDCTATRNTTCGTCQTCTAGLTYQRAPCGGRQDTDCAACTVCTGLQFRVSNCSLTGDTERRNLTSCVFPEVEATAPTATSDRVCR